MSFIRSLFPSKRRRPTDGMEERARRAVGDARRRRNGARATAGEDPVLQQPGTSASYDRVCRVVDRELRPESLRMVVLREENQHVLFDSATVQPLPPSPHNIPRKQISQCGRFQLMKRSRDIPALTQMLFGAMPAATGSDSFKIHAISESSQIMVSRIFTLPRYRTAVESIISDTDSQYEATVRSLDALKTRTLPAGTAPPERFTRIRNSSLQEGDGDEEMRAFSPPHRLSKDRRRLLSHRTNLCHEGNAVRWKSRSRLSSCGSSQAEEENTRKVALGVLCHENERRFLFAHMALIESELARLEMKIEAAATQQPIHFFALVDKAWRDFVDVVCILANAPRLRNPVWLSMVAGEEPLVSGPFCDSLAELARELDTKENHYFLSNVISTVLMHHMSWVASVAPPLPKSSRHGSTRSLVIGTSLNEEAHLAPYNVHLAQYLEVVGSVGAAGRSARTVVTGEKEHAERLLRLLHVLSYFIRCSGIKSNTIDESTMDDLPAEEAFSPLAVSPCDSVLATSPRRRNDSLSPDKDDMEDDAVSSSSADSLSTAPVVQRARMNSGASSLPIPTKRARRSSFDLITDIEDDQEMAHSLGSSLLVGPCPSYSSHFVLSGFYRDNNNVMIDVLTKMLDDVRSGSDDSLPSPCTGISQSSSSSSGDVLSPENVVVLIDATDCTVKVLSSDGVETVSSPSEAVVSMIEQFVELHSVGLAPKFLLSYLEDCLADLLSKSFSLVELVTASPGDEPPSQQSAPPQPMPCRPTSLQHSGIKNNYHRHHHHLHEVHDIHHIDDLAPISPERVRSVVGCDHSDLRLLVNVAAVYAPRVLDSVV